MDHGTDGDDAYWRRRVLILVGGMATLGLLAWALPGPGASRPSPAAQQSAVARLRVANELPPAAYGSAARPGAAAVAQGSPAKVRSARPARARVRVSLLRVGASCPAGSVVMTVFSAKPGYAPGERPVFEVYAVSTDQYGCAFRFGPGAVRVLVTQHGRVVWNSAECRPAAVRKVRMHRGVPVEMAVTWDRRASLGCRGRLAPDASGVLAAVARTQGQSSPPAYFNLVR